ncbi:hypothetical protein IQ06DRAFT_300093 [Phaeosphaeriaceae sp. SRC1lsM3a]|nr:hypothetical protein IQ06DRAFT_300093 [Stagonospora sp. SRC1lsM3a]
MTDDNLPRLDLPSAALHARTHREPHVDSEEAVQYERERISRELDEVYPSGASRQGSEVKNGSPSFASLRSRNASLPNSAASGDQLRLSLSAASRADTGSDAVVGSVRGEGDTQSSPHESHWYTSSKKFWDTHVNITIEEGAHRDHLALERTFLGYLRTSLILVMTGVLTAQLFRLQHAANPNVHFGFYVVGRPLSIMFIGMAIVVVLVGAYRFWKLQNALIRGKAYTGGWEVLLIMGLSVLLVMVTFALVLGVNIDKALDGQN